MSTPSDKSRRGSGGLEGILSGLSGLLATLGDLAEKGEELKGSQGLKTKSGKDVSFHYGFAVRTADGGRKLHVEPFGNMNTDVAAEESPVKEVREPLTDTFEEDDCVLVVVEMPGIDEKDATFEIAGDLLTITADRPPKRYRKELLLPIDGLKIAPGAIKCNNGVFEARLTK